MIYFALNMQTNKIQEIIIINSYDEEAFTEEDTIITNDYEVILQAPFDLGSAVNYLDHFEYDSLEDKFIHENIQAIEFLFRVGI